jgi:hypothetical protein
MSRNETNLFYQGSRQERGAQSFGISDNSTQGMIQREFFLKFLLLQDQDAFDRNRI